jgi:hypothetical protein
MMGAPEFPPPPPPAPSPLPANDQTLSSNDAAQVAASRDVHVQHAGESSSTTAPVSAPSNTAANLSAASDTAVNSESEGATIVTPESRAVCGPASATQPTDGSDASGVDSDSEPALHLAPLESSAAAAAMVDSSSLARQGTRAAHSLLTESAASADSAEVGEAAVRDSRHGVDEAASGRLDQMDRGALLAYRAELTLELAWMQQAIASREKVKRMSTHCHCVALLHGGFYDTGHRTTCSLFSLRVRCWCSSLLSWFAHI